MAFANFLGGGWRRRSSSSGHSTCTANSLLNSAAGPSASYKAKPTSASSASQTTRALNSGMIAPSDYIFEDIQLATVEDDPPDLRELNACLGALSAVFPDIQVQVFREMLTSFDGESRLFVVADALLKSKVSWVKGRWRVPDERSRPAVSNHVSGWDTHSPAVERTEAFRTPEYKRAVRILAFQEFRGLSRSTVNAVLAENNYDYLSSRKVLIGLGHKSWRFALSNLIFRRRPPAEEARDTAALVSWRPTMSSSAEPTLKATGNAELDRELFQALVEPLRAEKRHKIAASDLDLAIKLNKDEAEKEGALIECACCCVDVTFEELCSCSGEEAHGVCFRCVQHCVSEAVFGQGWRLISNLHGTLKCPAVGNADCNGFIPQDQLRRAVASQLDGAGILRQLDHRLSDMSLAASGLPLVRCPFCEYAEVDDVYLPPAQEYLRIKPQLWTSLGLLTLTAAIFASPWVFATILAMLFIPCAIRASVVAYAPRTSPIHSLETRRALPLPGLFCLLPQQVSDELRLAAMRHLRRQRGLRFVCLSPTCGRASCLSCLKPWTDIHICHESALIELRTEIERAMSLAIKRVCPRCNTSFVKSSGCNKLCCPCGYKMCYICRKDIGEGANGGEGYRHFCDHFRPEGDGSRCRECDRCNLWEAEDTEAVLKRAKDKAEADWRSKEGRDISVKDRRYLQDGASLSRRGLLERLYSCITSPGLPEICDFIMESIFT